jgi:serine/threonine-protein kinase
MGQVYLAHHRHLRRDAAIKVLLPHISTDEGVIARFFGEARATARLRHPNIVEVFDCDVLPDGRAYIVMEYLRGESLRKTLDRLGRLSPDFGSVAAIVGMIADALQAAHTKGIVHRDLKPDNAYLAVLPNAPDQLTVKVLDFGIAKLLAGDNLGPGVTRTGALLGTPMYMSPEQCRGVPTLDQCSDIYSLGCVIFELIAGRPPFVAEAPGDLLLAHMTEAPPALGAFEPNVPAVFRDLVERMLSKDPSARPQSMAEVAQAMASYVGIGVPDLRLVLKRPAGFDGPSEAASVAGLAPTATPDGRPASPLTSDNTPLLPISSGDVGGPDPGPGDTGGESGTTDIRPARTKWALMAVVPLGLALVGGGVCVATRSRPNERTVATTREPVAPVVSEPPAKPAVPAEVEFVVTSVPAAAQVWLAGEPAPRGSTPWRAMLPRSGSALAITLKSAGYLDKTVQVDATRGRHLELVLEPVTTAPMPATNRPVSPRKGEKTQPREKGKAGSKYEPMAD